EIRFPQLAPLQYQPVPARIFRDFLSVVSKGRFYDGVIKGKFPEIKIK
ncbi:KTSC domain-containing protein, partial [Citrobacter freundii]